MQKTLKYSKHLKRNIVPKLRRDAVQGYENAQWHSMSHLVGERFFWFFSGIKFQGYQKPLENVWVYSPD